MSNDEPSTASPVSGLELLNLQRSCLSEVNYPSTNLGIGRILCIDLPRQTVDACRHAGRAEEHGTASVYRGGPTPRPRTVGNRVGRRSSPQEPDVGTVNSRALWTFMRELARCDIRRIADPSHSERSSKRSRGHVTELGGSVDPQAPVLRGDQTAATDRETLGAYS